MILVFFSLSVEGKTVRMKTHVILTIILELEAFHENLSYF